MIAVVVVIVVVALVVVVVRVTWLNWNGKSAYIFKWWFHLAPIRLSRFALSLLTSLRHCFFFVISLPSLFCSFHLSSSLFISLRLSGPSAPFLLTVALRRLSPLALCRSSSPFAALHRPFVAFRRSSSLFISLRRCSSFFISLSSFPG